ncbi:phage tail tape measure protein, TP901 family, core region [Serratia plymuthica]|uniref:phage tail tape measure protein n=1 Tax=Serratia plymuthica TaxID=82996 RepID=UPI00217C62C7|nr:phage tail tape measure protein [Serratia plymuthica]CAI0967239.1 phage tail tape measure protein, TP901 family, core region [Serratia plymuthica]
MSNTDSKEALAKEDAAVRNLSKKLRLEQKNYSQLTQLLKIKEAQSDIFQKFEEIKKTRNTLPKFLSSPEDIETTQQVNLNYVVQKARGAIASFQQNRLERQLQAKGIDTADLVGAQQQAQKKLDVTQSYINHHRGTGQKLRQQRRTEVLDDFQTRQNGIGKIRDVSSQGFGLANKAFHTGKKLLVPGIKFEQQMSGVQAQLGLDSGDQRLIALRQQATSRAAKGQSAQDVTQAQSALASAGYNPQDVLAAVPAALNLAKASGSSIDEAVKALSGIQQAFQLPADQAENIADVMAKASSSYQLSLSDLDKKMQAAAPAALKNGMGLEQTAAQLAPQGRSLGKVDGAAQAIVTVRGDNLDGDIQKLFASWDSLRINLFAGQSAALRELTQTATQWLVQLNSWVTNNPALASTLLQVAGGLTLLLGGLSGVSLIATEVLQGFTIINGAIFKAGQTMIWLGRMAMANPLLAIIGLIAIAAFAVIENWDKLAPFFSNLWESISAGCKAMSKYINDTIDSWIKKFMSLTDLLPDWMSFDDKDTGTRHTEGEGEGEGGNSWFAGMFDNGGNIPAGQFGIVGENGPELVSGPVQVTGRRHTAAMSAALLSLSAPVMAASPASVAPAPQIQIPSVTINVTAGAGQSEQDIGREVARQFELLTRRQAADARSRMS